MRRANLGVHYLFDLIQTGPHTGQARWASEKPKPANCRSPSFSRPLKGLWPPSVAPQARNAVPWTWCPQVPEADSRPPGHGAPSTRMTAPPGMRVPQADCLPRGAWSPIPLADWPNRTDCIPCGLNAPSCDEGLTVPRLTAYHPAAWVLPGLTASSWDKNPLSPNPGNDCPPSGTWVPHPSWG